MSGCPPSEPAEESFVTFLHLGAEDQGANSLGFLDGTPNESSTNSPAVTRKHREAPPDPHSRLAFIETYGAHNPVFVDGDEVDCDRVPIVLVAVVK